MAQVILIKLNNKKPERSPRSSGRVLLDSQCKGSLRTKKAGYTIIVLGITITRSGNTSVPTR